jgi:16S rRNA processing protein RimM
MKKRGVKAILERRVKRVFDHKNDVLIGKIVGVHGVKGDVKVKPESDVFERQMESLKEIPIYRGTKKENLKIESMKPYKDLYIVKFEGVNDRTAAEERIGSEIWIDKSNQVELEEGEYYFSDLLGCKVITEDGREIGKIAEILEQPASHVLEVEKPDGKRILIPFIEQFVKEIDLENKKIVVSLLEGMEE